MAGYLEKQVAFLAHICLKRSSASLRRCSWSFAVDPWLLSGVSHNPFKHVPTLSLDVESGQDSLIRLPMLPIPPRIPPMGRS